MTKKTKKKLRDGNHTARVTTSKKKHKHGETTMQMATIDGVKFYRIIDNKRKK